MKAIDSKVINVDELKLEHYRKGKKFEGSALRVGALLGAKDLGYSYLVVPPGKCAVPFHSHRGSEEMFFITRGKGTLRYGNETRAIRAGDVICCPTGGPSGRSRWNKGRSSLLPGLPGRMRLECVELEQER
jgi:uncharacterized cupin superfamily protein